MGLGVSAAVSVVVSVSAGAIAGRAESGSTNGSGTGLVLVTVCGARPAEVVDVETDAADATAEVACLSVLVGEGMWDMGGIVREREIGIWWEQLASDVDVFDDNVDDSVKVDSAPLESVDASEFFP